MKNTPIRVLVILGAISLGLILVIQVHWVNQALTRQEEQFNHTVKMSLRSVVESLCEINGNDIPSINPIDQVSSNYFIARTNNMIDLASLEYFLDAELKERNIQQDYEFGVYDCQTDRMVYGDIVSLSEEERSNARVLPKLEEDDYYFGVLFPGKKAGLLSSMDLWKLTTALSVLILILFAYAIFVVLRQKRLSEIQRDFINNMSHEFKTPLSTLQIAAEVLQKQDHNSQYASIISSEVSRLQSHVNRLLETASVERRSYQPQVINVRNSLEILVQRFHDQTIFSISNNANEDLSIQADIQIWETILFNLVDNAVKYGEGKVDISLLENNSQVIVTVKNHGKTIPKQAQSKIFDKFYRVTEGDTHDVKGFGLGLYLVKANTKKLKGQIEVASENGETCFTLKIPKYAA